jgi:hypothetical protein
MRRVSNTLSLAFSAALPLVFHDAEFLRRKGGARAPHGWIAHGRGHRRSGRVFCRRRLRPPIRAVGQGPDRSVGGPSRLLQKTAGRPDGNRLPGVRYATARRSSGRIRDGSPDHRTVCALRVPAPRGRRAGPALGHRDLGEGSRLAPGLPDRSEARQPCGPGEDEIGRHGVARRAAVRSVEVHRLTLPDPTNGRP